MTNIVQLLADEAEHLLGYRCTGIPRESLHLPGPDYVDRVVAMKDRKVGVLRSLQCLYGHGRLAHSGYLSILPVDQGVEHSAAASFAPNPIYFDPENTHFLRSQSVRNAGRNAGLCQCRHTIGQAGIPVGDFIAYSGGFVCVVGFVSIDCQKTHREFSA